MVDDSRSVVIHQTPAMRPRPHHVGVKILRDGLLFEL